MEVDAYLARIGYTGSREPTIETLTELHRAHQLAVPFENLDIHLGRPICLSPPAFYDKIVGRHRGGFCYELNGLFGWLLEQLGFAVVMLSARVYDGARPGPEFDHLVLLVDAGEQMIADVGFGDSFLEPLRIGAAFEVVQHGSAYRLTGSRDCRVLERRRDSDWEPQYTFSLIPRRLAEFGAMCERQQTSPESHFTRKTVCSLATADGRITLSNSRLITTAQGRRSEREIESVDEYRTLLRTRFGIDLGDEPRIQRLMVSRSSEYIHGTEPDEQARLSRLNGLLNAGSLRELRLRGGERILDVGSGLGQLSNAMARAAGTRVVAVERSSEQIAEAERQAALAGDQQLVEFRQGDALNLPLLANEWGSFDVAHTRFLLEHLRDPLGAVRAMVQAVRPGGRIILEDDDHDLLRLWPDPPRFGELWLAYQRSFERMGNDPSIGRKLPSLLVDAGAAPVRNTYIFFGSCAGDRHFADYVENLIGVIRTARTRIIDEDLLNVTAFDAAIDAVRKWSRDPAAAIWYAMSWAEGRRVE